MLIKSWGEPSRPPSDPSREKGSWCLAFPFRSTTPPARSTNGGAVLLQRFGCLALNAAREDRWRTRFRATEEVEGHSR